MTAPGPLDNPVPVRPGEELDPQRLAAYLHARLPHLAGAPIQVLQFPGGHSNLTYLLHAGPYEMVLRRPPFGARIKSAHDMRREYTILSHLLPVYPLVPRPLLFCDDEEVMGASFYVMERLQGLVLRASAPPGLDLAPAVMRALSENFVDNLVRIHAVDYRAAGLGDLAHPQGYIRRQVEGWTQRYLAARTDELPDILRAGAWLAANLPPESAGDPAAMIHNDYKYDNLVLDPTAVTRIIGVLDWEMATIGHPLMDFGTSLGYWVDPSDSPELKSLAFGLTALPGNLDRRQLAERYAIKSGLDLSDITFYYVYALFKIAVIVQQIYARYHAGLSQDKRFAGLIHAVRALGRQAVLALQHGRIDNL